MTTPQALTSEVYLLLQCDPQSLASHDWTPEKNLQAEILYQSFRDLWTAGYPYSQRARRRVQESLAWAEDIDSQWIFAISPICDSLGFDADAVRAHFRKVVAQRDAAPAQVESTYAPLVMKLMAHIGQPEVLMCNSIARARTYRNKIAFCVPREIADKEHYAFHTRVVGSQVSCWIEEFTSKPCHLCGDPAVLNRTVCRPHLRELNARNGRVRRVSDKQGNNLEQGGFSS